MVHNLSSQGAPLAADARLSPNAANVQKNRQTTSTIVMIEPALFHLNFETALDDKYQVTPEDITEEEAYSLGKLPRAEAFLRHPGLQQRVEVHDSEEPEYKVTK